MIRPKRIIAQAIKELVQIKRDWLSLTLSLVLPLIMVMLFAFSSSLDLKNINLAIQDLDNTPISREYIATFESTNKFNLVTNELSVNVSQLLAQGKASIGITIPPKFARDLQRKGSKPQVQLLIDGSDANTANLVQVYANTTNNAFIENLQSGHPVPVSVQNQMWFNPGLETLKYNGPGAIALAMAMFPALLAGLATVKEREYGTIVQVYASSLTSTEYLLGKAISYWLLGIAGLLLAIIEAKLFFGLWFVGDTTPLIIGSVLYIASSVFWGIYLGNTLKSQSVIISVVSVTSFLLSLLLSGYIYPVENIPASLRWLSIFIPARSYILLTRDAFARGVGWPAIWGSVVNLGLLTCFYFLIAKRKLKNMQMET
jgi:ABC-2 type transport system permease protein